MTQDTTTLSAGDAALTADLWKDEGSALLRLTDKASGRTWGPAPVLALDVHDRTVRRDERLTQFPDIRLEEADHGLNVLVSVPRAGLVIGMWLRVEDGELVVRFSPTELYERRPDHFRLFAIDVLPGLMQAGAQGRMLLPIGAGNLCDPADKPALSDRFLLHMHQPRWELVPLVPVCGAWDEAGGLMGLASAGDTDTECRVTTDGEGNGQVGFGFSLRQDWPDPVDYAVRELRLSAFGATTARDEPCAHIARRLRRHVTETLGKPTLEQRAAESPTVKYALEAINLKFGFAQENEGMEMAGRDKSDPVTFQRGMTFDQAIRGMERLAEAGIDKTQIWCVGWNARGHDGLYPTRFPIDERLGGEDRFRAMIERGKELGYCVSVHDNFNMNVPQAPDYDPACVTHDAYGQPLLHGWWSGGLEYQSWPLAFPRERLTGFLERMAELGVNGTYYCDYMMQPLEVNHHPRHHGPRGDHAKGQMRVLEEARRIFGASACELGTLHGVLACDYVCNAANRPGLPHWPISKLMDKQVPVWDLALHGLVIKECGPSNWPALMRGILFGEHPRLAVCHDPYRPNQFDLSEQTIQWTRAVHELINKRFGHLKSQQLTAWAEPGEGVQQTRFEDGTTIVADFNQETLEVNGEAIENPAPALTAT